MEYINSHNPNFIKPLDFYITHIHFKNNNIYLDGVKNYDDLLNRLINYTIEHCINKPIQNNKRIINNNNNEINNMSIISENRLFKKEDEKPIKMQSIKLDDSNIKNNDILLNQKVINSIIKKDENINNNKTYSQELIGDINLLIMNAKEIENCILDKGIINQTKQFNQNNNQHKIDMKYEEKIFFLEKQISKINNEKIQLENQILELKKLMNQFQLNYASFSHLSEEENDLIIKPNKVEKINDEISDQINQLFSNKLFNECYELWKKYNFQLLTNLSYERSFEILVYLLKLKDRNNKKENKKNNEDININNNLSDEARKKNCEIVELLSNIELYRVKLCESELKLNDLKNIINNLIEENNELSIQNQQLKDLIQNNY
jgi:hypothetical protein